MISLLTFTTAREPLACQFITSTNVVLNNILKCVKHIFMKNNGLSNTFNVSTKQNNKDHLELYGSRDFTLCLEGSMFPYNLIHSINQIQCTFIIFFR